MTVSNKADSVRTLDFFIVPKIINFIPRHYFKFPFSELPHNIRLASPKFNHPNKIDVLLGYQNQIHFKNSDIILQHIIFD